MSKAETTRQRLQTVALELFTEKGFDNVTVDEIAASAGVSHMTFFRNFPTKESVVLDDPYDPLVGVAVADQDPTLPVLERVRLGVLDAFDQLEEPEDRMVRQKIHLAAEHSGLRARVWENNLRTEEIIVDALVGTGVARLDASVAAGAALGALTAALFDWASDDSGVSLGDRIRHALGLLTAERARS